MTDSLKAAAKAGNTKALEALMNKSFESKGVTVRVTSSGALLKILVRGKEAPDKALLPTIQKGLASIAPRDFEQAIVTARAIGKANAWSQKWDLARETQAESLSVVDSSLPVSQPAVKVLASSEKSKSWYQKNWLVISLLILFPLAGIPLAWMSKWPKANKIGASTASGVWLLLSFLSQPLTEVQSRTPQEDNQTPTIELAEIDHFGDAVRSAEQASDLSQTAKREEEWTEIAKLWAKATYHMKSVSQDHERYSLAQQKIAEYQQNITHAMNQEKSAPNIFAEDFGNEWPFTVNEGRLQCLNFRRVENLEAGEVVFTTNGKTYALNGVAGGSGKYLIVDSIWKEHPDFPGAKINIGDMISRGLELCK